MSLVLKNAINTSVFYSKTVYLNYNEGLKKELYCECNGSLYYNQEIEFWGNNVFGGNWKIKMMLPSSN